MAGGLSLIACNSSDSGGDNVPAANETVPAGALVLKPAGQSRDLPTYLYGVNSPITYDIPYENPKFLPTLVKQEMAPGWLRFPGGTVASYYNWRSGYIEIKSVQGGSVYRNQLVSYQQSIKSLHPKPITVPDFAKLCEQTGSELVFLPNLETSTVEEQTAWFADMKSNGYQPKHIEMGNEFSIALLGDAEVMKLFPNYAAYRDLCKKYLEAWKPYLSQDAKIATQADGAIFGDTQDSGLGIQHRQWQWDQDIENEDWFHAYTFHPYAPSGSIGGGTSNPEPPDTPDKAYTSMLARIDEGMDRVMKFFTDKLPGKEAWITEWGLFAGGSYFSGKPEYSNGIWVHQITRAHFAFLRWPQITMTNMHSLMCSGGLMNTFTRVGSELKPMGVTSALKMIFEATNGGAKYQPVEVQGAVRVEGQGKVKEGYNDVVAAMLSKNGETTLLIHNAAKEDKVMSIGQLVKNGTIKSAEAVVTPDLVERLDQKLPATKTLEIGMPVTVPGYSLTKIVWS